LQRIRLTRKPREWNGPVRLWPQSDLDFLG
jgi:hypothetical protein